MPVVKADLEQDGTVKEPINREPTMDKLVSSFLTMSDNYDRNHGPIQHLDTASHTVTVDGLVSIPLCLTMAQLTTNYQQHKVTAALQCAGNRRHTMRTQLKEVDGVDWFDAAVMNCVWEGPRLRDILISAGIHKSDSASSRRSSDDSHNVNDEESSQLHVQFASYGTKTQEDDWYGGSIPLDRALDPEMDVILAVKMNNEALTPRHGAPVRTLVPGALGARSVKWLNRITVAKEESPCYYQWHDYKVLPPDIEDKESAAKVWKQVPAMLDMPVNACVGYPTSESTVKLNEDGKVRVLGYAVPQASDGPVVMVQVSGDEGKTWIDANLDPGPEDLRSRWSWVLWSAEIKLETGKGRKVYAKATDRAGNTQTEARSQWNLRGVAYNGYEAVWGLTVI